ncbi:hypothetical protein [Komagataeibacter xylinus]|uniref:Uncharacterized protein n=1 Tax=Komagataeibacter xylinus TaxID=28448 RepID=A0A857FN84_KOMXY|nr:hypothetical protein [Komagataeibacter xylinus]QHC35666.1 hypothetical protein FMA36_09420 [Komagataeibacter xylinus]
MTVPPDYVEVREVCPVCSQGWVRVARDSATNSLFFRCDECGSDWEDVLKIGIESSKTRDDYYNWHFVESRKLATNKI